MPTYYECQRCTACCRWPGLVRVDAGEVDAIAAHMGLGVRDFVERYTRLRPDRRGLSLTENPDGSCVFLDGRDCRIQAVKPRQCRAFPNGWRFPGFEAFCRAEKVELSAEEYGRRVGFGWVDGGRMDQDWR